MPITDANTLAGYILEQSAQIQRKRLRVTAIVMVIVLISSLTIAILQYVYPNSGIAKFLEAAASPIAALFGVVVGYFFGQTTSADFFRERNS